ncbi:MAG: hypothetical protein EPO21_10130 [Chloroflexota bacterium]|nr:MAG: hypothetical protein EPO21_10130 [Chloroflexota bacterium]
MKKLANMIRLAAVTLVAASIAQELRKPPEERTWHGKVAGFVPYDYRVPTVERLREAYWDPDNPRVFTERAFGLGWGVNFPALFSRLKELYQEYCAH